jgi:hypothetical protein
MCAPSIVISKPKFHFLQHLTFYIKRFGPALLFATERYESFNTPFRLSCIYSNRQAPSRDSAITFANLDRVKHIVSGGWWYNAQLGRYVQASTTVLNIIQEQAEYAKLLGFLKESKQIPGKKIWSSELYVSLYSLIGNTLLTHAPKDPHGRKTKCIPIKWRHSAAGKLLTYSSFFPGDTELLACRAIVTTNEDVAYLNSVLLLNCSQVPVQLYFISGPFA